MAQRFYQVLSFVVVILGLLASTASAQELRVVVLDFSGPGSAAVRNAAVRALSGQRGLELLPSDEVKEAGGLEAAASKLSLNAFVDGVVRKRGRRWTATITVKSGDSQEVIKSTSFRGRNARTLARSVQRGLWGRIGSSIRSSESAGEGPAPVDEFEDEPEEEVSPGSGKRVVVRPFSGDSAEKMRAAVVSALKKQGSVELVEASKALEEAEEADSALSSSQGRVEVGRELRVDAFVVGRVQRQSRRRWRVQVMVQNAKDGEKIESMTFSARSSVALEREIESNFWKRAGDAIEESSAPGASSSDDEFEDDERPPAFDSEEFDEDDSEEDFEFSNDAPSPLRVAAFYKQRLRNYSYNDAFGASAGFTPLSTHETWLPTLGAEATWYPAAHFSDGFAANLGLDLAFATIVGVQADLEVPDPMATGGVRVVRYDNSSVEWHLGLRYRIPVDSSLLSLKVAYGNYSLEFGEDLNADPTRPNIPDVKYSFLRLGVEGDVRLGDLILRGNAAYLYVLSPGSDLNQIANAGWFPNLSVGGLEAGVAAAFDLDGFEVGVGFDLRYFYYSMNNEPGDNPVAGGAVDLYLTPGIFVGYVIPGST